MGVVNVTPDSFSDGGRYLRPEDAIAHARRLVAEGADVVDVGGESSRPGAETVDEAEELRRVVPVVEALAAEGPAVRISVDTVKPAVARAAVGAGATLINDIGGTLWPTAADLGVGWVAMHMQGTPRTMQHDPHYADVVSEVHGFVLDLARRARAAGVEEVWVDPGIGFGKTPAHNLALVAHLDRLVDAARDEDASVLVGTSRKSFLGAFGAPDGRPLPPAERLEASLATVAWALSQGCAMVRVHDVAPSVQTAVLAGPPGAQRGRAAA